MYSDQLQWAQQMSKQGQSFMNNECDISNKYIQCIIVPIQASDDQQRCFIIVTIPTVIPIIYFLHMRSSKMPMSEIYKSTSVASTLQTSAASRTCESSSGLSNIHYEGNLICKSEWVCGCVARCLSSDRFFFISKKNTN